MKAAKQMPASILYISYTGLLDPLGQSQVLQYVLGLARDYRITLLTFEKPHLLQDTVRLASVRQRCRDAGIDWHRLTYHNKPGIPATVFDIAAGCLKAIKLARGSDAQVVHTRSYVAGIMGMFVKRFTGARFVFDMRGFWPDERVDGGIWRRESIRYRFFKGIEKRLFSDADHIVSLTKAGVVEFTKFDYLAGKLPAVSVIPTCTNLEIFRPMPPTDQQESGFTLGYVGSAGSWYMFAEVARTVRILFEMKSDARFRVINQGNHDAILSALASEGIDRSRVELAAASYETVSEEIANMDAGIFFIKPVFSKRASCPTRMGEFLACGKPCLANGGVGDVEENLNETGTGVAINSFEDKTLREALKRLIALSESDGIAARCRKTAEDRFSLEGGVKAYSNIYTQLTPIGSSTTSP